MRGRRRHAAAETEQLLQGFAQNNPELRRQGGYSRANIGGRQGLTTTLSNVSEVTASNEAVNVSTVQLTRRQRAVHDRCRPAVRGSGLLQRVQPGPADSANRG